MNAHAGRRSTHPRARNAFITDMNDSNSTIFIATAAPVTPAMLNSDTCGDFRLTLPVHGRHRIRIDTEPT